MAPTVQALIAERQRQFIEQRLLISQWVSQLMKNVHEIDQELLVGIDVPSQTTAEELLPSLFKEPFDLEQYNKEKAVVEELQRNIDELADKLNQEALKCLSE